MHDLRTIAPSCGVLIGRDDEDRFAHLATAWAVGEGEWVSAWPTEEAPRDVHLQWCNGGSAVALTAWEWDNGIAGFTATVAGSSPRPLAVQRRKELHKRDRLWALGYPSMIDHPAFRLHRGSLDAERYFPYLCPWTLQSHLAVFTADDGFIGGRYYAGMAGGPVLDEAGDVVGVILDGVAAPDHPALTRFRRLV